ncbi:MAG: hypothetical protein JSW64_03855 [Candidatus Zixiibacteriota bacterium]|nr:MAG: hypothetical protein JSW64_03855 [candidate division Zixibacteria bacterium]
MRNLVKITVFSAILALFLTVAASAQPKRPVKYPLGFKHGMSQEAALKVLKSLEAPVIKDSERSIHAHYNKEFYGVVIEDIDLEFFEGELRSVSLRTAGEKSDEDHNKRLRDFIARIRSIYDVNERPNGSSVDSTTDIKTRFVSRYEDGSYELLIYSYYLDDRYYLSLNYEKFF